MDVLQLDGNVLVLIFRKLTVFQNCLNRLVCKRFSKYAGMAIKRRYESYRSPKQTSFTPAIAAAFPNISKISVVVGKEDCFQKLVADFSNANMSAFKQLTLVLPEKIGTKYYGDKTKLSFRKFSEREASFLLKNFVQVDNITYSKPFQFGSVLSVSFSTLEPLLPMLANLKILSFCDDSILDRDMLSIFQYLINLEQLCLPFSDELGLYDEEVSNDFSSEVLLKSLCNQCPKLNTLEHLIKDVSDTVLEEFVKTHPELQILVIDDPGHPGLVRSISCCPKMTEISRNKPYMCKVKKIGKRNRFFFFFFFFL